MNVPTEKITTAIAALHAAEKALLTSDTKENCVTAGQCAVAAVLLEVSMKIAGAERVVHLTGELL